MPSSKKNLQINMLKDIMKSKKDTSVSETEVDKGKKKYRI